MKRKIFMNYKSFSLGNPGILSHTDDEPSIKKENLYIEERLTSRKVIPRTAYALIIVLSLFSASLVPFAIIDKKAPFEEELFQITNLIYISDAQVQNKVKEFLLPQKHNKSYIYKDQALISMSDNTIVESKDKMQDNIISIVKATDYSTVDPLKIFNETSYTISAEKIMMMDYPVSENEVTKKDAQVFGSERPSVLIIHTHGTECYSTDVTGRKTGQQRSYDTDSNVVAVGRALAHSLNEKGIGAIHCEEMFDKESYINSYSRSYSTVNEYLSNFPSIKYVIDLHRDAISDENGNYIKALSDDGIAQLMLVIGTDEAGSGHKDWENNLRVALEIQSAIYKDSPTLMRPIYVRKASFNQQLSPGYFILEAGTCANELSEVFPAIEKFAESFSKTITKDT